MKIEESGQCPTPLMKAQIMSMRGTIPMKIAETPHRFTKISAT